MFQFDNMMFAGSVIVRNRAESQNYQPSGGTDGWAIFANGDAFFYNIVARGDITADSLSTGPAPGRRVVIDSGSSPDVNAGIEFYSGIVGPPSQILPEAIYSYNNPLALSIDGLIMQAGSMSDGDSGAEPSLLLAPSTNGVPGFIWFQYIDGGFGKLFMDFDPDICLRIKNATDVSLGSTEHPFQIGEGFTLNLCIDDNEIMARNAGANATLNLNNDGGTTHCGGDLKVGEVNATDQLDGTARPTTSTSYVQASSSAEVTGTYSQSGTMLFLFSGLLDNTLAAETCSVSVEVRDTNDAGTVRAAGSDNARIRSVGTTADFQAGFRLIEGLPTSGTFWAGLVIKSSAAGNTASMDASTIAYIPVI